MLLRWTFNGIVGRYYLYAGASWTGYSIDFDSFRCTMSLYKGHGGNMEQHVVYTLADAKAIAEAMYVMGAE